MYPSPRARPDYRTPTVWSARAAIATDRTRLFPNCGRFRNSDLRKLRGQVVVSRGESWEVSTHLDVSEVSRLGLVGGTTGRAGADARPENEADGAVASPESRRRAASALIESHDGVFRRTARRYSICAEDAEDAYQRALEILLTKAPQIEGDSLVKWMQTVTKREALGVRRQRERLLGSARSFSFDDGEERD